MKSSKCGQQDFKMQWSFFKGGISTKHFIFTHGPPFLCFPLLVPAPPPPTPTAWRLQSGSDALAGVFPSRGGWSILFMTSTCCDQVDHDRGKAPHEHMSRSLTSHHPAHFLISRSPCSIDKAEPEEGRGGGWLVINGLACHPRLGSFIVQEVLGGGAQRPFGCDPNSE